MSQLRPLSGPLVALALGAVTAALPAGGAQTLVAGPFATQLRQSEAREETREGRRMELGELLRRVAAGRPGRMVPGGVQPRGDVYVIQWEYPGGRVVDITVDARTARVLEER
ncbi:MAG: hypothetical protein ACK5WW_03355 [Brevundimonas sp.]|jgi:hypothetical protein|uniref:hypothetical protein n=1 Tax=Brevundimonas sp. TaxID=1871086 RepID=UPI00391900D7